MVTAASRSQRGKPVSGREAASRSKGNGATMNPPDYLRREVMTPAPAEEFPGFVNVYAGAGLAEPRDEDAPAAHWHRRQFLTYTLAGAAAATLAGCRSSPTPLFPMTAWGTWFTDCPRFMLQRNRAPSVPCRFWWKVTTAGPRRLKGIRGIRPVWEARMLSPKPRSWTCTVPIG
jgi:hypothetical protein